MSKTASSGDWLLIRELFDRGDPSFVEEIRRFDNADTLAAFAPTWINDRRAEARRLLLDYLDLPLNAYRHEGLVKRLFKLAEASRDHELMGAFLVAFDRSIRRVRKKTFRWDQPREYKTEQDANEAAARFRELSAERVMVWKGYLGKYSIYVRWSEPVIRAESRTTMPRGVMKPTYDPASWDLRTRRYQTFEVPDWVFTLKLDPVRFRTNPQLTSNFREQLGRFRLFSTVTRQYLRRRAWRYFRKLGRSNPEQYLAAVIRALLRYRDTDAHDGLAMIDNWSLMHLLFHFSPVLIADHCEWKIVAGRSLAELEPAPIYARLWAGSPRSFVDLLMNGKCRVVLGWAIRQTRNNIAAVAASMTLEERLQLLAHEDPEVVRLAADLLREDHSLAQVSVEHWLKLVEQASPDGIAILVELIERWVPAERVEREQAVWAAASRPYPLARLGLNWLKARPPRNEADCRLLLGLVEAESEPLRPEIVRWVREAILQADCLQPEWVREWLDCRHEDVRKEGWQWFLADPRLRGDTTLWQQLMESPYDDIRLALVGELEVRARDQSLRGPGACSVPADQIRLLWASVLLNVIRGGRAKPLVVRQILNRIETTPDAVAELLPLLAVSLRSVRGPEWRAGLTAVVQLADRNPSALPLIQKSFPELQLC